LILVLSYITLRKNKFVMNKIQPKIKEPNSDMLKHLIESEGKRSEAYKDSAGKYTIGIGHLIKQGEEYLLNKTLSESEIMALFKSDVLKTTNSVLKIFPNGLPPYFYFPVFSLVFQTGAIGEGLKRYALEDDVFKFFETFFKYTNVRTPQGLVSVKGIRNRRFREYLFSKSIYPVPTLNVPEYIEKNKILLS